MKRSKKWRVPFLKALGTTANVGIACKRAGVVRSLAYRHRTEDEDFRREWDSAIEDAVDLLEKEAWRRAVRGTVRPVFYKGDKCGGIREYSDSLLSLLLKAHRPGRYRDSVERLADGVASGEIQPIKFITVVRPESVPPEEAPTGDEQ